MDLEKLAHDFSSFLSKHSGELRLVASTLQTVVDHLPIDQQDKERMGEALNTLQNAASNIAAAAATISGEPTEVVIDKADVVDAVREVVAEERANAGE